ncbi:hypothetical protein [Pseudodesulfovibrio sediminis]|uniref:Lipocalin-like domain-containing protein n=1 Tax=Pseudodesulfovibrio sediminis TaxID=2810563 RepID=A0ABN6EVD3_9BACT|nr:hypothetical protein [Pseudodesulfovibrio sediminis]BCS89224.1 hypothetical protein PSDVSF_24660 [Pseudodesulfovibrio sediminis]
MKRTLFSLLTCAFLLIAASAFAGDIPDMKGTWYCEGTLVAGVERGIYSNPEAKNSLVIEKQEGRVFLGYKEWTLKGKQYSEKLCGGIAVDGEIYIAEHDDGVMHGDLSEDGTKLTVFYVESGPDAKVIELIYIRKQ